MPGLRPGQPTTIGKTVSQMAKEVQNRNIFGKIATTRKVSSARLESQNRIGQSTISRGLRPLLSDRDGYRIEVAMAT